MFHSYRLSPAGRGSEPRSSRQCSKGRLYCGGNPNQRGARHATVMKIKLAVGKGRIQRCGGSCRECSLCAAASARVRLALLNSLHDGAVNFVEKPQSISGARGSLAHRVYQRRWATRMALSSPAANARRSMELFRLQRLIDCGVATFVQIPMKRVPGKVGCVRFLRSNVWSSSSSWTVSVHFVAIFGHAARVRSLAFSKAVLAVRRAACALPHLTRDARFNRVPSIFQSES